MMTFNKPASIVSLMLLATVVNAQVSFTPDASALVGSYGYPGCVVDMNSDGLDDVVRLNGSQMTVDYQQGNGTFVHQAHTNTNASGLWSICAGDIDGNGFNDVCLGDGDHTEFLFANATGTAYTSDYHPEYIFCQRSTMADVDADGNLDAFVCHDTDQSHPFRNDGSGDLTEDQSLIETIDVGGNYAAIWCDYDNDKDIDLYITKCRGGAAEGDPQRINGLYQNNGGTFTEVGTATGMDDGAQSWSTSFEDFDNDGDFDAFIVNHSDGNRFMENDGSGNFTNIIATTGLDEFDLGAWECQSGDFNNDGWVDLVSEVGAGVYLNNGDMTFTSVSTAMDEGAIGDLNNDGWLDLQNYGTIYYNDGGTNHYVKIQLEGIFSNKNGIGSRVEIYGDWGKQTRELRSGQGFAHMNALWVHFGLGTSTEIDSIVVSWPSGIITTIENPGIDQTLTIPEATCTLPPNTIAVNGNTEFCLGETVELTADGGFTGYQWSNGATTQSIVVSAAGNYSVTAFDSGDCVSLSNNVLVTVVEDETPTVSMVGEDAFCEGGEAVLTSSSASGYMWSNGETTQSITVSESGNYNVTVTGLCSSVASESVEINVSAAAAVPVADDVSLPDPGVANMIATGDNIEWYDTEFATSPVGSGNNWDTPFLNTDATYWVEANAVYPGATQSGGKLDNGGGGGLPSSGAWSYFDAWEPFTIETVKIYAYGAGIRTIQLADENENIMESVDINLVDGEQVVTLNFPVPVGSGMSLRSLQNDMFRNNSGVSYPYSIGTVGELYDSYYGGAYYYYFYDWTIQKESMVCPSDRDEVHVFVNSVGIEDLGAASGLSISPNPATDLVNISFDLSASAGVDIEVIDALGKLVYSMYGVKTSLGNNDYVIDMSQFNSGIYNINFHVDGKQASRKIMVK